MSTDARDAGLDLRSVTELTDGPDLVTVTRSRRGLAGSLPPRRLLALAVLAPLVLWALLDSEVASANPLGVLVVLSLGAGLALASYVPLRGQSPRDVLGAPCAAVGGVVPLACAASVLASGGTASAVISGGFVAFALYQRFGNGACRTP